MLPPVLPTEHWEGQGYIPNPYFEQRKLPLGVGDDDVDCIWEGRSEMLNCNPIMTFIGPMVITHWRPARNKRGAET